MTYGNIPDYSGMTLDDFGPNMDRPWEKLLEETAEDETWRKYEDEQTNKQFESADSFRLKGNAALEDGDYEKAYMNYCIALEEMEDVGESANAKERRRKECLSINSNMAMGHLRCGTWAKGKDYATRALGFEPTNAKALFRRGIAEARLASEFPLYHDGEARAAQTDFETILEMDSTNEDACIALRRLRREMLEHKADLAEKQKKTWGGVFGPRIEDDVEPVADAPPPKVRPCTDKTRHLTLSLDGVSLAPSSASTLLKDFSLELRQKWCVGLFVEAEASRAALAKLVTRECAPHAGKVIVHDKELTKQLPNSFSVDERLAVALGVAGVSIVMGMVSVGVPWPLVVIIAALCFVVELSVCFLIWEDRKNRPIVLRVASDSSITKAFPKGKVVKEIIGSQLSGWLDAEEREARVGAMLRAVGAAKGSGSDDVARLIDKSLRFGELTDTEQRLVHLLWCFAQKPTVLVCDDVLAGLDEKTQLRVLRMISRMKQDCKLSVLYLSSDLAQLRIVSDSLGILKDGELCELGPAQEVLEFPRSTDMKELFAKACENIGKKFAVGKEFPLGKQLRDRYTSLLHDAELTAPWLPNSKGFNSLVPDRPLLPRPRKLL